MALTTPPRTPPSSIPSTTPAPTTTFNIVAQYNQLAHSHPTIPPALLAIESLIALLASNPLTTISETLSLITSQSQILLDSQPDPIPIFAGTDLFSRYLIASFQQRSFSHHQTNEFTILRNQLISNSKVFVSRAKQAGGKIAVHGLPLIAEGGVVFTFGESGVVDTLIAKAVERGRYFWAVSVLSSPASKGRSNDSDGGVRKEISIEALPLALSSLKKGDKPVFIIPSTAVMSDGSILAGVGTHTLAILAKHSNVPVYVAAESFKFVRKLNLGTDEGEVRRLGARQASVLGELLDDESASGEGTKQELQKAQIEEKDIQEIVPANLITALVTENGIMTTAEVSEEEIKLWF
jgi:translation initiation factor eIF-2B subunit alpha